MVPNGPTRGCPNPVLDRRACPAVVLHMHSERHSHGPAPRPPARPHQRAPKRPSTTCVLPQALLPSEHHHNHITAPPVRHPAPSACLPPTHACPVAGAAVAVQEEARWPGAPRGGPAAAGRGARRRRRGARGGRAEPQRQDAGAGQRARRADAGVMEGNGPHLLQRRAEPLLPSPAPSWAAPPCRGPVMGGGAER